MSVWQEDVVEFHNTVSIPSAAEAAGSRDLAFLQSLMDKSFQAGAFALVLNLRVLVAKKDMAGVLELLQEAGRAPV